MKEDTYFNLQIIAFGTHCSSYHGKTIQEIRAAGFKEIYSISSLLTDDDEESISTSYGLTVLKFANYWRLNNFDLVICLGDRFEMSAAVQAGVPFGITFAHIHGGETSSGAIDNIYRHQISIASQLHFTSTEQYARKVKTLTESDNNIYVVGALSLDGLENMEYLDEEDFRNQFGIPKGDFILATFHPETVATDMNKEYASEMEKAIKELANEFILVITMPNADTHGSLYRGKIEHLNKEFPYKILAVENFGKQYYFSAMKHAELLLGNSSSGIIEAASLGKYVVNVGNRQKGRAQSQNVINCPFKSTEIVKSVKKGLKLGYFNGDNIYYKKNSSAKIVEIIKNYNETL
jgi:GDP/UDP-N,N'-diacetylbacillosamine 2-epimerase (hydrolysing)